MSCQQLIINSRLREAGSASASDFYCHLVDLTPDTADLDISIANIAIPRSYYGINSNNNSLALGSTQTITITPGDYTASSFITEFQTQESIGITMAYNTTIRHFTFNSGITGFNIVVPNSQYKYLGLSVGTHTTPIGTTSWSLESDEVVDLSGTNEINIETSLSLWSVNNDDNNFNRLVSIFPNAAAGDFIQYTGESFGRIRMKSERIDWERFTLRDEWNQILDLNGRDWNMAILLHERDTNL